MRSMSLFRCVMALASVLVAGATSASSAAAQLYVMESTVAAIRVGSAFDMNATIALPAGSYIRAVLPSGKTQTVRGPYKGTAADLGKGQPSNDGVMAWVKEFLKTGR